MADKWFAIMVVGCALSGAIAVGASSYSESVSDGRIAVACVESGGEWKDGDAPGQNYECVRR